MLYNKDWGKKADIHSLESLIAWLETKPPKLGYDYVNSYRCLLSQYYKAMGLKDVRVEPHEVRHGSSECFSLSQDLHDIAIAVADRTAGVSREETFGAALERARYLQKERENA